MAESVHLDWPFFEAHHAEFARVLDAWAREHLSWDHAEDVDSECRRLVRELGREGWLRHAAASAGGAIDPRAMRLIRETLARHSGLADFMPAAASKSLRLEAAVRNHRWGTLPSPA